MKPNENILRSIKKLRITWIVLEILMLLMAMAGWVIVEKYSADFGWGETVRQNITLAVLALFGVLVLVVAAYFVSRIRRTKVLLYVTPQRCRIEDILIHSYVSDKKVEYQPFLLVRDLQSGKRYFSYGKYCLSLYHYTISRLNHGLVDAIIFRKDGSRVSIGDEVKLYVRQPISVDVTMDGKGNLCLQNKKYSLHHAAGACTKKDFEQVIFVEAFMDVE